MLFAEAGKEFVDFLFKILVLPVTTFIPLLNQEMVGSLRNIYDSIENLSPTYLQPNIKDSLLILKPKVYISGGIGVPLHLSNIESSKFRKFYKCNSHEYMSDVYCTTCPSCEKPMSDNINFVVPYNEGVKGVTYMVMDHLEVKPMSTVLLWLYLTTFVSGKSGLFRRKWLIWAWMRYVCLSFLLCFTSIYFFFYFNFVFLSKYFLFFH